MNLCLRLAMSWVGRRVFTPPDPPVAVAWQSVTANGSDGATTSTQLTFTFDVDPGELSAANFTIEWATKGTMTGTGTTRVLPISDITADNNTSQTVTLASNPSGYTITPTSRSVTVYVQDIAVEWQSLTANGTPDEVTTTELTLEFDADPGPLTVGNFILFNADITGISGTGTGRVLTINNIVSTELTLSLTSPAGYDIDPSVRDVSVSIEDTVVPITITLQPTTQTADEGNDATFTLDYESAETVVVQWVFGGTPAGTDSKTFVVAGVTEAQNATSVYAILDNGTTTVQTDTVYLNVTGVVDENIYITQQPVSRTVNEGQDVTFTVAYNSELSATEQWKYASDDSDLVGEISTSLTYSDVMLAESGTQVYCRITNSAGFVDTNTVTLTVVEEGDDPREPSWISNYSMLAQDGNGNTDVAALIKSTSKIMYIDPIGGDDGTAQVYDENDFLDPLQPGGSENAYATETAAFAQTRDGFPDVVLYKRGTKTNRSGAITLRRGESLANRQVVSCYGNPADAYPIVNNTAESASGLWRFWKKSGGYNTAFIGIRFTWDKRDPRHEDFAGINTAGPWGEPLFYSYKDDNSHDHSGILIERCWGSHFGRFATISAGNSYIRDTNIVVRRCTIYETYNDGLHAQGLKLDNCKPLEEDNIVIRAGWTAGVAGTGGVLGDFWRPNLYKHTTYATHIEDYIRRNCLSFDPSSIHTKVASWALSNGDSSERVNHAAIYGNFNYGGEVVHNVVGNKYAPDNDNGTRARDVLIADEVTLNMNHSDYGDRDLKWGTEFWDIADGLVDNCLLVNFESAGGGTFGAIVKDWAENVQVTNCIAYEANGAEWKVSNPKGRPQTDVVLSNNVDSDDAVAGNYVDPDRDLFSYMAANSIGDGTDPEDYIAGALEYWETLDSRFSPTALRDYIRAGFVEAASNEIAFSGLSANGSSGTTTTTTLTLTFDEDPTGLAASNITVTGATKGALSGTGTTRSLAISAITVADSETVNVAIANNNGNTFTPTNRDVTVYKEALNEIAFSNLTANGTSGTVNTDELTLTFDEDPTGLAASDITVTGATKGALSGTGTTRTLAISAISVANEGTVNVAIADNNGNTFSPTNRDVAVYKVVSAQRLTFNGTDGYGAYNEVSVADGDTVTLTFNSSESTGTALNLLGRDGQTSHIFRMDNHNTIRVRAGALCYYDLAEGIYDGEDHEIVYTHRIGTVPKITVDGDSVSERSGTVGTTNLTLNTIAKFGSDNFTPTTITEFAFSISSTVTKYELNNGSTTTISASIGTGTLTLYNVVSGDWN